MRTSAIAMLVALATVPLPPSRWYLPSITLRFTARTAPTLWSAVADDGLPMPLGVTLQVVFTFGLGSRRGDFL
ncbi:MAG: hypothetical protein HY909_16515 [Deltaproteobacteria bacterium]|nr:hypothetical protein [Deltaproteobacteria bacterium]